jgi:hypothetical protein
MSAYRQHGYVTPLRTWRGRLGRAVFPVLGSLAFVGVFVAGAMLDEPAQPELEQIAAQEREQLQRQVALAVECAR